MKNKLHLSAFTLMELTIAMLISAICLGIAFFILNSFYKFGTVQQKERTENLNVSHFYHHMNKEIRNADEAYFLDNVVLLKRNDYISQYIIMDSLIIRKQGDMITDSLLSVIEDIQPEFVKSMDNGLIKSINITLKTKNRLIPFVLSKDYSAEQLIKISN
ncbi:prepilin-type N-terminal cleavage/methylation domain-containing protein [Sphingobacterium endophyticum]|uniref:prepilin-type N-terminal cleavage/methylation domain-containing protein n=1 Tax=Sphingobacterium endophyticum TaxID=2546448 RepID=UPI0012E23627|nr:prepilin-type N-terminal cleavage/methylation domain-containing protein [Sphingobacterium endophyticum]